MNSTTQPLASLRTSIQDSVDLFICSASFERRCVSIAEHLDGARVDRVLIAHNQAFRDVVDANLRFLRERFVGRESTLLVDSADPLLTTNNVVEAIRGQRGKGAQRVLVDITAFTHETLLILFRVCSQEFDEASVVDFLYAPASEYSIGDEPGEKWLSKGISEVRSVMGYPGGFAPSRDTHLIVLAGFEDYRALSLTQELEPTLVSIGYGDRSEVGTRPHQVTNEAKVERIRSVLGSVETFVFSCYDALSAEETIRRMVRGPDQYNTILAPMNTKMSTLGAARVALKDESIQICYAQADIYNYRNYSRPGDEYYVQRFNDCPFGTREDRER